MKKTMTIKEFMNYREEDLPLMSRSAEDSLIIFKHMGFLFVMTLIAVVSYGLAPDGLIIEAYKVVSKV